MRNDLLADELTRVDVPGVVDDVVQVVDARCVATVNSLPLLRSPAGPRRRRGTARRCRRPASAALDELGGDGGRVLRGVVVGDARSRPGPSWGTAGRPRRASAAPVGRRSGARRGRGSRTPSGDQTPGAGRAPTSGVGQPRSTRPRRSSRITRRRRRSAVRAAASKPHSGQGRSSTQVQSLVSGSTSPLVSSVARRRAARGTALSRARRRRTCRTSSDHPSGIRW